MKVTILPLISSALPSTPYKSSTVARVVDISLSPQSLVASNRTNQFYSTGPALQKINPPVVLRQPSFQCIQPTIELIHARRVGKADKTFQAKGGTGDEVDVRLLERELAKARRIGNQLAANRATHVSGNVEKRVEGSVRDRTPDAPDLLQPAADEIAPGFELATHFLHAGLIPFQRRQRRILADAARAA